MQKYWLRGSSIPTIFTIATILYLAQKIMCKNCKSNNRRKPDNKVKKNQEAVY